MAGMFGTSQQQQQSALGGIMQATNLETQREDANKQMKAAHNQQVISTTATGVIGGAMVGGPIGAVVGGAIGYVVGELF